MLSVADRPWGRLVVVERADAFVVAPAADIEDWIACFDKAADFPAREWAENMVRVYNARVAGLMPQTRQ